MRVPLVAVLMTLTATLPLALEAQKPEMKPTAAMNAGGRWWQSLEQDQKWGYIEGHDDCWVSDAKNLRKRGASVSDWIAAVDEWYAQHPSDRGVSIHVVLNLVDRPEHGNKKPLPGAEVWTEPHGYLDGLWWRGASAPLQSGYLEGYLGCHQVTGRPPAKFSKSIQSYRKLISGYVEAQASRDDEKLANILYRFRDR